MTTCACGHTYQVEVQPVSASPDSPSVGTAAPKLRSEAKDAASQDLICPRCHVVLADHDGLKVCEHCAGLFVSTETLKMHASRASSGQPLALNLQARTKVDCSGYVKCPRCANWMHRANFSRVSGVVVDICAAHGTWFDGDELGRALKFLAEHPEAEAKAEAAAEKAKGKEESARDLERRKEFAQAVGRETYDEATQGYARAVRSAEYDQRMNDSILEDVLRIFIKIF
jgi:Zn-finger nucleic acid-binding protein